MKLNIYLLIVCLFYLTLNSYAQDQEIDSLKSVINNLKDDSVKVNALNNLSSLLYTTQPDVGIMYAVEAKELGKNIKFEKGVALALKYIGLGYYIKADFIKTIENWNQSIAVYDSIGDQAGVSNLLNNLGSVYFDQGDEATGVDYFFKKRAALSAGRH